MKNVADLGEFSGPVILFGGPYSNVNALSALLDKAAGMGVEPSNMISTGDIVAYCADGQACIDLIRKNDITVVAGNCEKQLSEGSDDCGCGFEEGSACAVLAGGWYPFALASIDAEGRSWLGQVPDAVTFQHNGKRVAVIHGGVSDISRFLWSTTDEAAFAHELDLLQKTVGKVDLVVSGHSGIAFQRVIGGITWINAGAVGMPQNDGDVRTVFTVLGETGATFERLDYDHNSASAAMIKAGLTQGYEVALQTGYWPSEDVLPIALRRSHRAKSVG